MDKTIPDAWREWYEERAAFMQYGGRLPREDAEREAFACLIKMLARLGTPDATP